MIATAPRRGRPGYDQDRVVAVCVETFNRHGYDATSMSMLAAALGLSKAAIYHHAKSKEHLLELGVERALGQLDAIVARCRDLEATPGERLRALIAQTADLLVAELPYVTLLLRLRGNTPSEQEAMARRREITRAVQSMVEAAQRSGEVRADLSAPLLTRLLLGQINSVVEWYQPAGRLSAAEVAEGVTRLATDALAPRAAR